MSESNPPEHDGSEDRTTLADLERTMAEASATIRPVLQKAPVFAERHLRELVGRASHELPQVMVAALKMLPQTGPLRKDADKYTVMSVSILLPKVPEDEPLRSQIEALHAAACERAPESARLGEELYRVSNEAER